MSRGTLHLLASISLFTGIALLPASTTGQESPMSPIASFVATIYWARADAAFDEGRLEVGLARAEQALKLDPEPPEGWSWLASVLVHRFGAPEFEETAEGRRAWAEAGLAVLARGESKTSEPEELAFHAGLILAFIGSLPLEVYEWPGGERAIWLAASDHFERAKSLGHPRADAASQSALRELHWPSPEVEGGSSGEGGPSGPIHIDHTHDYDVLGD